MKYLVIFLFLLIPLLALLLAQNANGMLVGDGRKETDVILVGNVLSFVENKTSLETRYLVGVEKYLKTSKNYDTNTKTVTVISTGLRQYDDPQQAMVYERLFNIDDRVLFLLYQKDGILRESLYSQTTKSNCSPNQLLDEMYGEYGLHISQNNQTRHFYTNRPIDLTFYGYNIDLKAEKKDFEFKVNVPQTGQILSEKTQLDFQACKRTASASWNFIPTVVGRYGFHSIIGNNEGGSQSFSGFLIEDYVESPFKQFKAGIHFEDIKCRDSLTLVTKYDGSPACVKLETKIKLLERGWIKHVSLLETKFQEIKYDIEQTGYGICDIKLEESKIIIDLNWIFNDSSAEKEIISKIPFDVDYEIIYHNGYTDYFINEITSNTCDQLENEN
jgi:hypothetical protein